MPREVTATDEIESFAAYEGVSGALRSYIDGARSGESAYITRAFLEDATIRGSYGGQQVDWTLKAFCELIDKGGPAPDLKVNVVGIEFCGSAAMARLEAENWRGTRYTDFFTLILRENEWRIASKVFYAHARA
jgi:hypothetical protein